jgi:hypothetical protein
VSGDRVLLLDDASGRMGRFVQVLARLPREPRWVLIGGLAVNVRLGRVHRATNDVDTVTHGQPRLVELLVEGGAQKLSAAKVRLLDQGVEVDVMESTEGQALPIGDEERAFALVRRWVMTSAGEVELACVMPEGSVAEPCHVWVASRAALIALKSISIPRRQKGSYPQKVGSDIQDLYRLAANGGFDEVVAEFARLDLAAGDFVSQFLVRTFSVATPDLRYSFARLRRYSSDIDAATIEENGLVIPGELGTALGVRRNVVSSTVDPSP